MKIFRCYLVIIVTGTFMAACQSATSSQNEPVHFIQRKADSLQKTEKLPGIFIGILRDQQRDYYGSGYARPDNKQAFDSATLFEIGSISKTFTAYVLESVLKEKNISDSASILSYLPDSVQQNRKLAPITFLSLLNHSSGLPRLPDNMDLMANPMSPYDDYSDEDLFAYLKICTPQPDGHSNYSNLGAGLAGVLARRISGENYETLARRYVFTPFGITQHPDSTIAGTLNKADGFFNGSKAPYWSAKALAPAGGLKCSAEELLSYLHNIAIPPVGVPSQIISTLLEPTLRVTPEVSVCRAWHTMEEKDKPVIYWHNGGTYGFSTFAGFLKGKDIAVVIVINAFDKNKIADHLGFEILHKLGQ